MFLLHYLYFALNLLKMDYNAFYEIIPPYQRILSTIGVTPTTGFIPQNNTDYEITPPQLEEESIEDKRMRIAIERFASFDEYMDIPMNPISSEPEEPEEEDTDDDNTVLYDDEEYRFEKCGQTLGYEYDYSEFSELDTIVPDFEDYQLPEVEGEGGEPMDISQQDYEYVYDDEYYLDPDYIREGRIERMMDYFQDRD